MATKGKRPKRKSIYDIVKGSPILSRGEKLCPFTCFAEKRDWNAIGKYWDEILANNELPEFDERPVKQGWIYIQTKKGKKRLLLK